MKISRKRYFAVVFLLFLALFFSPRASAQTQWKIWDWHGRVAEDKVWKITFNQPVDASSVNMETLYIEDGFSRKIPTKAVVSLDGRSIELIPRSGKYEMGERYTLFVREILRKGGGRLRDPVKMSFRVRSNPPMPHEELLKKREMLDLINHERRRAGLGEVVFREAVFSYADLRAREIVQKFDHIRPDGSDFSEGMPVPWQRISENIAAGERTAAATMQELMDSPRYRRNILHPEYTQVAIGYHYDPNAYHEHYWVQLFLKP